LGRFGDDYPRLAATETPTTGGRQPPRMPVVPLALSPVTWAVATVFGLVWVVVFLFLFGVVGGDEAETEAEAEAEQGA
jgi:hypothetical protein